MKSTDDLSLSIGELAGRFGLATHVLRHWESVGLLRPSRVAGERRRYGSADLYRVAVILRSKEAGFGLDDIGELLAAETPAHRRTVLERQRHQLRDRIAKAQASLDLVECALGCDHDDIVTCPNFRAFIEERALEPVRAGWQSPWAGSGGRSSPR